MADGVGGGASSGVRGSMGKGEERRGKESAKAIRGRGKLRDKTGAKRTSGREKQRHIHGVVFEYVCACARACLCVCVCVKVG